MKNLPNVLTIARILLSLCLFPLAGRRAAFLIVYGVCGLTDWLDGLLARRLQAQSALGARLDSMADLVWFSAAALALVRWLPIKPIWAVAAVVLVALIRAAALAVGWARFGRPVFLHTWANKAAGLLFFLCPPEAALWGTACCLVILFPVALAASAEELALLATVPQPDLDIKGWLWREKTKESWQK